MFFVNASRMPGMLRPVDHRLLLCCMLLSIVLHVAMLRLLPDYRASRDTPPKPLIVELTKQELPQVIEPPKKEPEIRPEPRAQPFLPKRVQPELAPPPVIDDRAPPIVSAPVLSVPPEAAAPVVVAPPTVRPPESPRPPAAPRVRTDAAYLHNPQPTYPMAARRRGDQGTVMVRVLVTADGLPVNVSLDKTSGYSALDEAAVSAVRTWRFVPARDGGQAVEALYIVPVVYKLN